MSKQSILIVDDKEDVLRGLKLMLRTHNFSSVHTISSTEKVMPFIHQYKPKIVLLDLHMPKINGLDILTSIKKDYNDIAVIIITADEQIDVAVDCVRTGAHDYFVKPVDQIRLIQSINAIPTPKDTHQSSVKKKTAHTGIPFSKIITQNRVMLRLFSYIKAIAHSTRPVLILGDTGTGKELFAEAIHRARVKIEKPMVTVNIAGLDDTIFTDTLFGHQKGAYTGAISHRSGLIKAAEKSSLFFDEIGDLNTSSQIKLLRLLQDGSYYPLGSDTLHYSQAKIITATNQDLDKLIANGTFRRDLYHRLQVHIVKIPTLAERADDIPLLTEHLVKKSSIELSREPPSIPSEAIDALQSYHFPGNVRELETILYNAVILSKDSLSLDPINQALSNSTSRAGAKNYIKMLSEIDKIPTIHDITSSLIDEAMSRTNDNVVQAAELLGISRQALYKRLKRNR